MIYARLLIYSSIQATVRAGDAIRFASRPRDETNLDNLATFYCVDRSEPPADHLSLQLGARIANCAKRRGCSRYGKVLLFTCFCFFSSHPFLWLFGGSEGGKRDEECHVSKYF